MGLKDNAGSIGTGLLGAAASGLVGGAINQAFNGMNIDNQVAAQKDLATYNANLNYQNQMKLWNATNYEAQREQMEKAGLNVGLMYRGSGGGGGTTGVGAGGGGSVSSPTNTELNSTALMQNQVMESQIKLNEAQANKANAEADYQKGAATENTSANTELTKANTQYQSTQNEILNGSRYHNKRINSKIYA